nr:hypothetical protein [Tanacetum cinerariifolium]
MSSDNAQSAVTYTSISSDSDRPSWGIPLMNAGEFPKMDPYEEVAQQGHVHPLSPAYIPDPMELDEHAPIYVPEPQHPEYHAPSDDDIQEDKITITPPPFRHRGARISVRPQTPMVASTQALIDAFDSGSSLFLLPPTSPAYDQAQLESSVAAAARAPRSQYDFVDTVKVGQGLIRSPGHDTQTIARAADRAEDASYVRALQSSEHRMMTSIEEVNLRVSYQAQLEARGLLTRQSCRRELLARLETLETHTSRMEWQRQSAEDLAVTQMMRIHTLEARSRTDMVEDADSSWDSQEKVDGQILSKRFILGTYLCAPSAITTTLGNVHQSVENARGHIKKNCLKLKNHGNGSRNGVAQGRVYALGGREASLNSNVIR